MGGGGCLDDPVFEKHVYMQHTHRPLTIIPHLIEMAKEQGAYMLLTNCPPCTLFLEQGLELMRESGGPMECGIFDFYEVFSRAFGEEEDGAGGS